MLRLMYPLFFVIIFIISTIFLSMLSGVRFLVGIEFGFNILLLHGEYPALICIWDFTFIAFVEKCFEHTSAISQIITILTVPS